MNPVETFHPPARRVLIASSHPLFGQGLRSLLQQRSQAGVTVVGMVASLEEALAALENLKPDLIIVDYDDEALNRDEFLARFVEGEQKLRVVLLSLQSAGEAVVYDRRTMAAAQIDDWLEEWTFAEDTPNASAVSSSSDRGAEKQVANRRRNMKHLIVAGILVIVVTALLIVGLENARILPIQASAQAVTIDRLFDLEFKIIAFLFALIVVLMVYSIIVFRRRKGDLEDAAHVEGNARLEALWTIVPLLTVLYLAYLGGYSLAETVRAEPQALEIKVIGQQWSWRFEYPDYGIISNELILPVDRQALLRLISNDVIHSFWVPEFRVKQDALPGDSGFVRDLRITPTMLGDYKVRCAELCGTQHATMLAPVRVISQEEFDAWVDEQVAAMGGGGAEQGALLAQNYGCLACHSVDGTELVGPTWQGLFQHEVPLADGTTTIADEEYLYQSIVNPGAELVAGFQNIMPANFSEQLTDDEINAIIEYIKTLR